jgi:hypothetical protein
MAAGPMVFVELKHKGGRWVPFMMSALDAACFWDSNPLAGLVWKGMRIHWGSVNARDWDMGSYVQRQGYVQPDRC